MARLDPAIRHAITPPEFGDNMIHRESLVDRLHGDIPNKLVAIAAPAGYGKTTLLADFVAHTDLPVCWVQVTVADRDLMRLVSVTFASLEKRFRRLRGEVDLAAYSGSSPVSLARTMVNLVDRKIPENFIFIMDDVHRIHGSEDAIAFIDELLVALPDQMTVFAAGREVLEVSLARLMAEGQLSGLGPHDLALDEDQIRTLIRLRTGQEVSDAEVSRLRESTRGWITGVILSEYGSDKASISEGLPEPLVYEYLASVVLNRQKDDVRRFMLDASVLPIMTVEACDTVLSRNDSEEMLGMLADKGLFLTISGEDPRTYEFHPIFRQLLTETLRSADPDRYRELRREGGRYYQEAAPEVAVEIYLDNGEFENAAEIAEYLAPELFKQGRFSTIESWLEVFPEPAMQVPSLQLSYARLLPHRGQLGKAMHMVNGLLETDGSRVPESVKAKALVLRGLVGLKMENYETVRHVVREFKRTYSSRADASSRASYHRLAAREAEQRGDLSDAMEHLDQAVGILQDSNDHYQLALAYQQQAFVYHNVGNLRAARKATMEAFEIAERYGSPLMRAYAYNDLGQLDYLSGDYEASLVHLSEARSLAKAGGSKTFEAHVLYGQGDVYSDLGLTYQAAELYGEGLDIATLLEQEQLVSEGCLATAVLHRRAGNAKLASEWLQRAVSSTPSLTQSLSIQSAALVASSSPKQALARLHDVLKGNGSDLSSKELTEAFFFSVVALFSLGEEDHASARLRECLDIVSLNGTEQYLAAELGANEKIRKWAMDLAPTDPTLNVVTERTQLMRALRSRYLETQAGDDKDIVGHRVTAFGGLQVVFGGKNVIPEMKPQALQVFIYLLDQGTTERDKLSDVFWPEHPPGRQTANLHMAIYSIRQAIGKEMVTLDGSTYGLSDGVNWRYDVAEFERAFSVAINLPYGDPRRVFALTEATNLYKGPFLPEYFSEWVEERRRELELSYLDVVAAIADEAIRRDVPDRALQPLREALKVDPYRDDLNRHYIQALARLDRRSDALSHYRKYASLIQEELGLDPSPSVKEAIDSISKAQ